MNLHFLHAPGKKEPEEADKHMPVQLQEHPHNTAEDSEFLDDAIRMKEQPLVYTEETVAAGCPDNML